LVLLIMLRLALAPFPYPTPLNSTEWAKVTPAHTLTPTITPLPIQTLEALMMLKRCRGLGMFEIDLFARGLCLTPTQPPDEDYSP
jgi:hypothetical protein